MNKIEQWRQAGFSQEEIDIHIAQKRSKWLSAGFDGNEINRELGIAKYHPKPMKEAMQTFISQDEPDSFWDKFIKSFEPSWAQRRARSYNALVGAEKANLSPSRFEPTMKEAFKQGFEQSVTGLIYGGKLPDNKIPAAAMKYLPTSERIAMQTATVAGDLPFMTAGALIGGVSGGPAAPLTAMGGAFALPAGLRKVYIDMYEKGQIQSFSEFWQRMGDTVMETLKGEAIGIATAATGARVPGMASYPAEIATMTTLGAAMEGTVPEPKDFIDAAIIVGGMKLSTRIASRLSNHWAKTGEHPHGVIERMKSEPQLEEKILSSGFEAKKTLTSERGAIGVSEKRTPEEIAVLETISVGEKAPEKPMAQRFHDLYTDMVDDMHPLGQVVKQMSKGEKVEVANDPYKVARLYRGVKGVADHFLEHSPFKFHGKKNVGKGFREILTPFKDDLNGIRAYVKAKRALELEARNIDHGVPIKEAFDVVKQGREKYEQTFTELKEYQDHVLQYLKDSGIVSRETYKSIKELNKDYVPFYRAFDKREGTGKGLEARDPLRAIKGSKLATIDPLESIIKNTYLFTTLAEKNRIGTTLVKLAGKQDVLGAYVKRAKKPIKPIRVTKEELTKVVDKYTTILRSATKKTTEKTETAKGADTSIPKVEGRIREALESRGWSKGESDQIINRLKGAGTPEDTNTIIRETIQKETERFAIDLPEEGLTIFRPNAFYPREDQIRVWKNGDYQLFDVHPDIARVFKSLDSEGMSTLTKILSFPAKWLRAGAILSPEFIARNPVRDQLSAFVFSKWGFAPAADLLRGVSSVLKKDKFYREWQKSGGMLSELTALDRKYLQKNLGEVLGKYPVLNRIKYNPIEMLRVLSELSEQGTRVGAFRKARKKGASLEEAGFEAREVTLDFARIGAKTRAVNSLVAFWNANIQGGDKMIRAFKDQPALTTAKVAAGITLPSVILAAVNHDDGRWDDIPKWQKDLFWIVMPNHVSKKKWASMTSEQQAKFTEENHIWRIPKPFLLGIIFGTIPERFAEALLEKNPDALEGIMAAVGRGASPGVLPTVAIPIIENWANKSLFLDRPLIPANREDLLPEYQYKNYTTEAAKAIGKILGKLPAIKENPNIAPVKIENLVRGWSGGLGMHIVRLASMALEKSEILPTPERPTATYSDWPVIKAFHIRYPSSGSESINTFYEDYFRAQKRWKTYKFLVEKEFNAKEAASLIIGHESDVVKLDGIYKGLSQAHRAMSLVYNNKNINADEKRQLIDRIYLDMSKMALAGNNALKQLRQELKKSMGEKR